MKKSFVFTLIYLLLTACATQKPVVKSAPKAKTAKKSVEAIQTKGVLFELLNANATVKLTLLNLDTQKEVEMILESGMEIQELKSGNWQIMGFVLREKFYETLLTSQHFVFKVLKGNINYGGSLVFQCPRVNAKYNGLLKTHKFFNRYPFKNKKGLCEMIVGNDFANVQKKLHKTQKSPLILGF
jgi:hypothetical protein